MGANDLYCCSIVSNVCEIFFAHKKPQLFNISICSYDNSVKLISWRFIRIVRLAFVSFDTISMPFIRNVIRIVHVACKNTMQINNDGSLNISHTSMYIWYWNDSNHGLVLHESINLSMHRCFNWLLSVWRITF